MSLEFKSLGVMSTAARGLLITGGTNATPIVATITAGHRLKNGDRIAITGVTGLTAMNGTWTVSAVAATTVTLEGSVGNGTFGGTAVVAAVCDRSPFLPGHSAVAMANDIGLAAVWVGTVVLEYADSVNSSGAFAYTNSSGVETAGWADALLSGEIALVAQTVVGGGSMFFGTMLRRYMSARCTANTTGDMQMALMS